MHCRAVVGLTTFIKVYGERNTGTNYIGELIALNLLASQVPAIIPPGVRRVHQALPGREWVRDLYFACTYRWNLGWKHGVAKPGAPRRHGAKGPLLFVTVTRNPYAWLLSLHRRPYHPTHPQGLDFETFLQTTWRTVGRDNMGGTTLPSPIELWNAKNRSYLALDSRNTLNTTAEGILADPKAFVDRIADGFGVGRSNGYFRNHEASTKERGKRFGDYRDYYLNERWRGDLTEGAVATINRSLDRELLDHYGYSRL